MEHVNNTPNFKEESRQTKPRRSRTIFTRFLGCFGFSRKRISFPEKKPNKIDILAEGEELKKQRSRFPWSWFCIKSRPGAKTVPLQSAVPESSNGTSNASMSEHQKTLSNRETPRLTPARVSSERTPEEKPGQTWYRSEQDIILGNGKPSDPAENPVDDKCRERLSFRRKIDAIRTGTSQPGSPEVKAKSIRIVSITRSASSPLLAHKKSAAVPNTLGRSWVMAGKPRREDDRPNGKKFDPLIGMSIVILTLMILLIWGKLCAILCAAAWFYFVPLLRSEDDDVKNGLIPGEFSYDSEEYKKKVVLEGFLQRKRRSIS
ncbi:hypothetical protein OIU74_020643 [Salix koriyanagi]|uniref:Uncharacterized protein n=1 Tax=Salix koriyanagi TaxID=2511006 RepID=A0A9Q0SM46_9ROSI|nr:hypothetical protein OIU74_020643 [Salix koriyanagi]